MLPATHKAMGYSATETDGRLTIHRVEIFCACERGGVQFDDAWIKKAVANAMQQQRGGYLPPLHVRHHEPSTEANNAIRAAGFFRITGTAPMTFKGARRTAIMADLIITDPCIQNEIKDARLPYRSVEIFDVDTPAIDGLALLDHEAPFLELPMLFLAQMDERTEQFQSAKSTAIPGATPGTLVRVAPATFRKGWSMDRADDGEPVVACFKHGAGAHLLFRQETDMAELDKIVDPELKPAQQNFAEDDKDKKEKDDEKSENMEGDEESKLDVAAICKAIASGEITVADMDAIIAAIQAQGGEATEEPQEAEQAPATAEAPGTVMKKEANKAAVQMAALSGKLEAMEALNRERDARELREKDVAAALERMQGRALGSDPRARWLKMHAEHGPLAFKTHIDEMAETFGVMPIEGGPVRFTAGDPKAPDCVLKFYKDGPDEGEKAARLAAKWEALRGSGLSVPLDRFVANGMKRAQA